MLSSDQARITIPAKRMTLARSRFIRQLRIVMNTVIAAFLSSKASRPSAALVALLAANASAAFVPWNS